MNCTDSLNNIEKRLIEAASRDPNLTNAEIAGEMDVRVPLVRDTRDKYLKNKDYDSGAGKKSDSNRSDFEATDSGKNELTEVTNESELRTIEGFDEEPRMRKRIAHLFHAIPDAVVETEISEGEAIVRRVNPGFEDIFGFDDTEIIGCSLDEFILPDGIEADPIELPHTDVDEVRDEQVVCRKTTTGIRYFLHRHIPYKDEGEQYAFEVYSDITEQKRRQAELEYQNQQLTEKREQAEEFVSILSHDLRNPINIAEGYLGQIKTPENQDTVEIIERALVRTQQLLDDTLELKETTDPDLNEKSTSIEAVAKSAWELVETGDSELRITDQFNLLCDSERTSRLFANLFRNAVEHNDEPVTVRISIHHTLTSSTRGETKTAFFISDDGCGIPEEKRETVLELGETESRTGTGLGLAIVDRVANAHGWDIRIVESFDGGAKFIISNVEIQ